MDRKSRLMFVSCKVKFAFYALSVFANMALVCAYDSPSIGALQAFPADNPWNWDISQYEVHPNSDNFIASVGADVSLHPDFGTEWNGAPNGIPYVVVSDNDPLVPVTFTLFGTESDPGPYRIPLGAQIEGGAESTGDRHVIGVDTSAKILYELYYAFPQATFWNAGSGAIYDLSINDHHPDTWTSADAAGLPIFPGLVRYEEAVEKGEINHAIRMTVENSQKAHIFPARHDASDATNPDLPPMGLRFRLKAGFDITGFPAPVQVILAALKKHGMIVADNGGNWFISGAPDMRWDDDALNAIKTVTGGDFEVVRTVDDNGDPIYPDLSQTRTDVPGTGRAMRPNSSAHTFDMRGRAVRAAGGLSRAGICFLRAGNAGVVLMESK